MEKEMKVNCILKFHLSKNKKKYYFVYDKKITETLKDCLVLNLTLNK